MCVGFWSLTHPDYALVLCANRDEFLARPTAPAEWHAFESTQPTDVPQGNVLSGRDLVAGGTWLGANKHGRVGFLTNITEPLGARSSSRGSLLASFLLGQGSVAAAANVLEQQVESYAGFNMVIFAPTSTRDSSLSFEAQLITNYRGGGHIRARKLDESECMAGGVSNGVDGGGGNSYPKVLEGVSALEEALAAAVTDEDVLVSRMLGFLTLQAQPAPRDSPGRAASISIAPIPGYPQYGTRVSTVLLVKRDGQARFVERDRWMLKPDGTAADGGATREFRFTIEADVENTKRSE